MSLNAQTRRTSVLTLAIVVAIGAFLTACSSDVPPEAPPRAVKVEEARNATSPGAQYAGLVRQLERADLSFEEDGLLKQVLVDVGDKVTPGQVLAKLDLEPMRLRLAQAQAALENAEAQAAERALVLSQQERMYRDGSVSETTMKSVRAATTAARAQVSSALADVALAKRSLRQAEIRAPYAGNIVGRDGQPDSMVSAGHAVLQIEGHARPQVVVNIPVSAVEAIASRRDFVGRQGNASLDLTVRNISAREQAGGTVEAIFDVSSGDPRTNQPVLLSLEGEQRTAITVPLSSVMPSVAGKAATVFIYQASKHTVEPQVVELGQTIGGRVEVLKGIEPGDQVVTAGPGFLSAGQQVVLFRSSSMLSGGSTP